MPSWSGKDRRQYEHIKHSEKQRGEKEGRAKEIAARTVNKQRRAQGRTTRPQDQPSGEPSTPLSERSRLELYSMAKDMGIQGRSRMNKSELVEAIQKQD